MNTRRIAAFGIGVVIMALVVIGVVTVTKTTQAAEGTNEIVRIIRADQKVGQERSKQTVANTETIKALADQIDSCTNPAGECAKRGQRRTARAVQSIAESQADIVAAAIVCANKVRELTTAEMKRCINRELDLDRGSR